MKRRDFVKSLTALSVAGSQIPLMAFGRPKHLRTSSGKWNPDRIVIMIKLNGGNDGLNTLIPVQDQIYYDLRPNLSLRTNDCLPLTYDTKLHPSMKNTKTLFDQGLASAAHGVGYPSGNLSHFRSSDIWVTGSGSEKIWKTGWLGRMFKYDYPDYPSSIPEHPIGIQMESSNLLEFQAEDVNMGTIIGSNDSLYNIIKQNYFPGTNDPANDNYGGSELEYIRAIDRSTFEYSDTIQNAGNRGLNKVEYPNTQIGVQLAVAAKLISGGLKTPVYRLNLGGFDTHANQFSFHADLLQQLDDAVFAFIKDMSAQEMLQNVLLVTTSEFGRRVKENGSKGTDHGTAAPIFLYGTSLRGKILGSQPNLSNLDNRGNVKIQYDYRQIYSSIMKDWFELPEITAKEVLGDDYTPLDLIKEPSLNISDDIQMPSSFELSPAYPNPFNPSCLVKYRLHKGSDVTISIYNLNGKEILREQLGYKNGGTHQYTVLPNNWAGGTYLINVKALGSSKTHKITYLK